MSAGEAVLVPVCVRPAWTAGSPAERRHDPLSIADEKAADNEAVPLTDRPFSIVVH